MKKNLMHTVAYSALVVAGIAGAVTSYNSGRKTGREEATVHAQEILESDKNFLVRFRDMGDLGVVETQFGGLSRECQGAVRDWVSDLQGRLQEALPEQYLFR